MKSSSTFASLLVIALTLPMCMTAAAASEERKGDEAPQTIDEKTRELLIRFRNLDGFGVDDLAQAIADIEQIKISVSDFRWLKEKALRELRTTIYRKIVVLHDGNEPRARASLGELPGDSEDDEPVDAASPRRANTYAKLQKRQESNALLRAQMLERLKDHGMKQSNLVRDRDDLRLQFEAIQTQLHCKDRELEDSLSLGISLEDQRVFLQSAQKLLELQSKQTEDALKFQLESINSEKEQIGANIVRLQTESKEVFIAADKRKIERQTSELQERLSQLARAEKELKTKMGPRGSLHSVISKGSIAAAHGDPRLATSRPPARGKYASIVRGSQKQPKSAAAAAE